MSWETVIGNLGRKLSCWESLGSTACSLRGSSSGTGKPCLVWAFSWLRMISCFDITWLSHMYCIKADLSFLLKLIWFGVNLLVHPARKYTVRSAPLPVCTSALWNLLPTWWSHSKRVCRVISHSSESDRLTWIFKNWTVGLCYLYENKIPL